MNMPPPSHGSQYARAFTTSGRRSTKHLAAERAAPHLSHLGSSGAAHMVSISDKAVTSRKAKAVCHVRFSPHSPAPHLVQENAMKKGDVLGTARIAGIMAAKKTSDIIPLCHPLALSHVSIDLELVEGSGSDERVSIAVAATVTCDGKTGVEMEALTAASAAALTIYDMCKAVDKGMSVEGLHVVLKEGGKSGTWVEGQQEA